MADQSFVEDGVYGCLVINAALGEAFELSAPGGCKVVHLTNVPPRIVDGRSVIGASVSTAFAGADRIGHPSPCPQTPYTFCSRRSGGSEIRHIQSGSCGVWRHYSMIFGGSVQLNGWSGSVTTTHTPHRT